MEYKEAEKYINEHLLENGDYNIWTNPELYDACKALYGNKSALVNSTIDKKMGLTEDSRNDSKTQIDAFIQMYRNKAITDEKTFDEFLLDLQKYKLSGVYQSFSIDSGNGLRKITIKKSNGSFLLEQDMIDFLVKQAMLDGSVIKTNPDKYLFLMEKVFEDFSRNINDVEASIEGEITSSFDSSSICYGRAKNGLFGQAESIILHRDMVYKFINNNDLSIISSIFHENEHVDQFRRINEPLKSYIDLMMLKEAMIIGSTGRLFEQVKNEEYYQDNYYFMFQEICAREVELEKTLDYIKKMGINLSKTYNFCYYGIPQKDIVSSLQQKLNEERQNYNRAFTKIVNGKNVNVNEYFLELFPDFHIENEIQLLEEYNRNNSIVSKSQFETAYKTVPLEDRDSMNRRVAKDIRIAEQEGKKEPDKHLWPEYDDFI